jgi:phosphohistidine phosphatase
VPLQLLIIRSAPAEDKEAYGLFGDRDDQRPLTDQGRESMATAARAFRQQFPKIDRLAASPMVRGQDTATLLAGAYGNLEPVAVPALSPGNPPMATLRWLRGQTDVEHLALVGHEPELGRFLSWLLVGSDKPLIALAPGEACRLDFPKDVGAGSALLRWSLTAEQLAALAAAAALAAPDA